MNPAALQPRRAIALCGAILVSAFAARVATNQHVIFITINGVGAYYLADTNASLPTLRRLMAERAVAEGTRVSNPAITWPNHTTLVTGVAPDKHSVLFDGVLTPRLDAGRHFSRRDG